MLPSPMRALGRRTKERTPDELHLAVITGRTKRIKHLIRKGVHIESVNPLGQTPLFSASYGGDFEVVEVLLRLGANPNRRCGAGGAAPIHAAAYRGSRRVLRALVEVGGDLSLRDSELLTPRDYALKQPSPIRRQKILEYFDLLAAMTLHQMAATLPQQSTLSATTPVGLLSDGGSNMGTLRSQKLKKGFFGGSQMSLARKASHQSNASVWSSCVSEASSTSLSTDDLDSSSRHKEIVVTPNLHKNVSCHLLDQLCVTTSLPLLSPAQLHRPTTPSPAYTCGGPTVYSSFTWIGTPVTVRRPTPALSMSRKGVFSQENGDSCSPDQEAVRSLLQELSFLRRLRHPGFLEVMAACHVTHPSPDHVTLVYQHVPYGSLYHYLHVQHHDLSVGGAVDILIGLVEALLFMHAHGFFHCGVSSHSLHLVSLRNAKLGGFEYAFETQVKGVGMRAEHLSKAAWLMPWQAPETVLEKMVSVRTEVYSVAAIIWEIWSGMPPWAGIEEEEFKKKIGKGEILPPLKGSSLSLVSYLTEYGLKWNAHERELDLQEVHTMLRSLRIQCNEEERVPAVTSWGPPSVQNTPVVGRQSNESNNLMDSSLLSSSSSTSSSGELRLGEINLRSGNHLQLKGCQNLIYSNILQPKSCHTLRNEFVRETKGGLGIKLNNVRNGDDGARRQLSFCASSSRPEENSRQNTRKSHFEMKTENSRDSGFSTASTPCEFSNPSTPCSRTPSPTSDMTTPSKTTILTSTPIRPSLNSSKSDRFRPDLLPNKVTPKAFMTASLMQSDSPPDLLTSGLHTKSCRSSPLSPSLPQQNGNCGKSSRSSLLSPFLQQQNGGGSREDNFGFVRNTAKRAFLQQRDTSDESDATTSSSVSSPSHRDRRYSGLLSSGRSYHDTVVKRGLSLSNICSSAINCSSATIFTRTTSHISLSSNHSSNKSSASSGDYFEKRPPQRTISHITLTLKKLSVSSSSSSSVASNGDSRSSVGKHEKKETSVPQNSTLKAGEDKNSSTKEVGRRDIRRPYTYDGVDGIKPASHQIIRHSSSCSLASGGSSPPGLTPVTVAPLSSSRGSRLANSQDSLSKFDTMPPSSRPLSVFTPKVGASNETTATLGSKTSARRHSETPRQRSRRPRRRPEMVFEEEFIDDEFDANLYDQPHMQLSVGSAENLLHDRRLSLSLVQDSASSSNLSEGSPYQLTSSEEDEETSTKQKHRMTASIQPPGANDPTLMGNVDDKLQTLQENPSSIKDGRTTEVSTGGDSEADEVFEKDSPTFRGLDDSPKDESRNKVKILTLEKNFKHYLPKYSFGSESEDANNSL